MFKKVFFGFLALISMSFALAAININTATVAELDTLKGIGPKKAQDIVTYREQHGPFKSIDDLAKVKGIGIKTIEKFRSEVTINGTTNSSSNSAVSTTTSSTKPKKRVAKPATQP